MNGRHPYPWADIESHIDIPIILLAERSGIAQATLHRWKRDGLTHSGADRVAIAVDRHPAEFWPEWLT